MAQGPDSQPIETRLERYRQMRADLGRLTVLGVRESPTGEGMVLLATGASREPLTLDLGIEPGPPHRLRSIRVEVGS
jgi:hypothetical protein